MKKVNSTLACIYRTLGWFPVVIINAIVVWSYFAYVIILCFDIVSNELERGLYLVFFHLFFVMFMYSYWKSILSSPGFVPSQFFFSKEDLERYENSENPQDVVNEIAKGLPVVTWAVANSARYCGNCYVVKPDRSHHCTMCGRCILKMDHHCPWVNNCIGWGNYKYFILFLFYAILFTMYVALSSLKYFIQFWTAHSSKKSNSDLHILFLFFVSAMFSVSLWSLFGFHLFLLSKNRTTLESFRAPLFHYGADKDGFNIGTMNNIRQVFGNTTWKWFFPIFTTLGNGCTYLTSRSRNSENTGLLLSNNDDDEDSSHLSPQTSRDIQQSVYTSSTFVNGDININLKDVGSDDEEELFHKNKLRSLYRETNENLG
ncbi:palmitoyltransferase ZDHHC20-B isoform X1 [Hydra vulgaris]|uniref:palmitoyltransferase ZDHHC20-B isoform X1 n=1 Tax=Hydra vulgaris TaxID=6087 RepID=UPI001F5F382B|nr:palmitoyltransferase ZDHHC20-B isoform X1 [Hydra vulgaris]